MTPQDAARVQQAKQAALEVLLHNMHGPYRGLPRTAGWGYPEPYTRDLMIALLGVLASGHKKLIASYRRVLETLAKNQTRLGHIPSLVHDPENRGASDTTPLFLLAAGIFRRAVNEPDFLASAVEKSLTWMDYQSIEDRVLVPQLPTSDWRDEQWVLGYGLFVNTVVYSYLRCFGLHDKANVLQTQMNRFSISAGARHRHVHEGLSMRNKPYYALYSYKINRSERFDLLGNSIALLSGLASPSRASHLVSWIEQESAAMRRNNELDVDLPPNFFPYIYPSDPDWMPRYEKFNRPGEYHNGGIWPFVCGFYVAGIVAAGKQKLAEQKLLALTDLIKPAVDSNLSYGFNEWCYARDGQPAGQDWQTWSAAMYLYAATSVEAGRALFFDEFRTPPNSIVKENANKTNSAE
ncbi:MAG: amylo-alpha-1,6-glucosidase [Phycisphaerae bacterium]|nr:amylo-alpha-1,6-glucosidase [Phycisphaerae bacterium]